MTPHTGAISLSDVRTELGLSGAISLGDSLVRKTFFKRTGSISLNEGYGVSYTKITSDQTSVTMSEGGLGGPNKTTTEIASGVTILGDSSLIDTTAVFVSTRSYVPNQKVLLINNGTIYGKGGKGGNGGNVNLYFYAYSGSNGGNGGSAVYAAHPVSIENNGVMYAGGGGGGGGGSAYDSLREHSISGSGGGAGGYGAGAGLSGSNNSYSGLKGYGLSGSSSTTTPGVGGASVNLYSTTMYCGAGGNGGAYGSNGNAGGGSVFQGGSGVQTDGGAGGAGGKVTAVFGTGSITWEATGTRYGTIS